MLAERIDATMLVDQSQSGWSSEGTCERDHSPKCRHDHRLKQHPRWKVKQFADATLQWTTPSGRQYLAEPTRYPI
jgi:hypothetical protein